MRDKLYIRWQSMKGRCYNPSYNGYQNYGGRGITVCDEWLNDFKAFKAWALSSGYKKELQIHRIDNNAGYSPGNCTWLTPKQNSRLRDSSHIVTALGETKLFAEWVEDSRCVVDHRTLFHRWERGWDWLDALTTPKNNNLSRFKENLTILTAYGEDKSVKDWSNDSRCVVKESVLRQRLKKGWPLELAISTPEGIRRFQLLKQGKV